jgi:hypothetical protein
MSCPTNPAVVPNKAKLNPIKMYFSRIIALLPSHSLPSTSLHRVRKLICPPETLARAITNFPPTAAALTRTGRAAPSINQNIPRIAHTDISTAKITDIKKISATAAPSIKASTCPSIKSANAKQNCTLRANPKTIIFKGNSPIHRQEQRVTRNTLWV